MSTYSLRGGLPSSTSLASLASSLASAAANLPIPAAAAPIIAWMDAHLSELNQRAERARQKAATLTAGGCDAHIVAPVHAELASIDNDIRAMEHERRQTLHRALAAERRAREQAEKEAAQAHRYNLLAEARTLVAAEREAAAAQQTHQQLPPHGRSQSHATAGTAAAAAQAASPPGYRKRASVLLHVDSARSRHHHQHQQSHSPFTTSVSPSPSQSPRSPAHGSSHHTLPPLDSASGIDDEFHRDRRAAAATRRGEFDETRFGRLAAPEAAAQSRSHRHARGAATTQRWIVEERGARRGDSRSDSGSDDDDDDGWGSHPRRHVSSAHPADASLGHGHSHEHEHGPSLPSVAPALVARTPTVAAAPSALFEEDAGEPFAHASSAPTERRSSFLRSAESASSSDLSGAVDAFLRASGAPPDASATDALADPLLAEKVGEALRGFIEKASASAAAAAAAAPLVSAEAAPATEEARPSEAAPPPAPVPQVSPQEKLLWGLLVGALATEEERALAVEWWQRRERQLYAEAAASARACQRRQQGQDDLAQRHHQAHRAALGQSAPVSAPGPAATTAGAMPVAPAVPPVPAPAALVGPVPPPAALFAPDVDLRSDQQQSQQYPRIVAVVDAATAAASSAAAANAVAAVAPASTSTSAAHAARGAILNRMHQLQEELRQVRAAKLLNERELARRMELQAAAQAAAQAHALAQAQGQAQAQGRERPGEFGAQRAAKEEPRSPSWTSRSFAGNGAPVAAAVSATSSGTSAGEAALATASQIASSSAPSSSPIEPMCRRFIYSLLHSSLSNLATLRRQDATIAELRWALAKAKRLRYLTENGSIDRPPEARPKWVSAVSVPSAMPPLLQQNNALDFLVVAPDEPPRIPAAAPVPVRKSLQQQRRAGRSTTGEWLEEREEEEEKQQHPHPAPAENEDEDEGFEDDLVAPVHRPGRGWTESRYVAPVYDARAATRGHVPPPLVPAAQKPLKIAVPAPELEAHALALALARSRPGSAAANSARAGYVPPHPDQFVFAEGLGGGGGGEGSYDGRRGDGSAGVEAPAHGEEAHRLYAEQRARQSLVSSLLRDAARHAGTDSAPALEDLSLLGSPPPLMLSAQVLRGLDASASAGSSAAQLLPRQDGPPHGTGTVTGAVHKDEWGEFVRGLDAASAAAAAGSQSQSQTSQTAAGSSSRSIRSARARSPSKPGVGAPSSSSSWSSSGGAGAGGVGGGPRFDPAADPTGKSRAAAPSAAEVYAASCATGPRRLESVEDIPARLLPRREYAGLTLACPHPDHEPDANTRIRAREKALLARARRIGPEAEAALRRGRKDFVALFAAGSNSFEFMPLDPDRPARRCFAECVTRYEVDHHVPTAAQPMGAPRTPRGLAQGRPASASASATPSGALRRIAGSTSRPGSRPLSPRRLGASPGGSPRVPQRPATARQASRDRPVSASVTNVTRASMQLAQQHRANGGAPGHSIVRTVRAASATPAAVAARDRLAEAGRTEQPSLLPSRARLHPSPPPSARTHSQQQQSYHEQHQQHQQEQQQQQLWAQDFTRSKRGSVAASVAGDLSTSRHSTPISWSAEAERLYPPSHAHPGGEGAGWHDADYDGEVEGEGEGDGSDTERDFQLAPSPSAIFHAQQMLALAARPAPASVQRYLQPAPPPQRSPNRFRHYRQGSEW